MSVTVTVTTAGNSYEASARWSLTQLVQLPDVNSVARLEFTSYPCIQRTAITYSRSPEAHSHYCYCYMVQDLA